MAHVVLVGGIPESLILFRAPLIRALLVAGHRVTTLAGAGEPWVEKELAALGAAFQTYPLDRAGTGLRADIGTWQGLTRRFRELQPDAVIAYTAKPVIWGALAARRAGVPRFHAMVTGLGEQFDSGGTLGIRARLLATLYRRALAAASTVVFQNADDRAYFIERRFVAADRTDCVAGSGIDLTFWRESPLPVGPPVFLMVARLLAAKGVREYAEAARRVRADFPEACFRLMGRVENGERAVTLDEVNRWHESGDIEFLGALPNAREALSNSHVFVLPSYYGEGVPRTILEAMATGRPVLSTHNVGCRDAVDDGVTGRLVTARDTDALEAGMRWFLAHRESWVTMGSAGRRRAESVFDAEAVSADLLAITGLGADDQGPAGCETRPMGSADASAA